jgi:ParB-like chromosome segregation protein Spo0J
VKNLSTNQGLISRISTTEIKNNQILTLSVDKEDVQRCTDVILQYGLLTPPVIGDFSDGRKVVLAGECEFLALKKLGVKDVDAITIQISAEEAPKISLLIASLKKSPNAITEGMMVVELLKGGQYNQYILGKLLGKSKSWVSKRISLATRLHPSVRDLVSKKHLCPHSAQEIARMPEELQHNFAVKIVQGDMPKSVVETLVSSYNNPNSPESLKTQILEQPSHAIEKITKLKSVKTARDKKVKANKVSCQSLQNNLVLLLRCVKDSEQQLPQVDVDSLAGQEPLLKNCKASMQRFCSVIENTLKNIKISPGKQERNEIKCQSN